jgi:hypothetical protein
MSGLPDIGRQNGAAMWAVPLPASAPNVTG